MEETGERGKTLVGRGSRSWALGWNGGMWRTGVEETGSLGPAGGGEV